MDTPRPALKKRITISRWGPALNSAEKGANIEATHQSLPNGTGSGSKEAEGKIVCRIMKVNKGSNFGEKTPVISKSSPKTFDEEQNSSETGDFLGFVDCEPETQNSFLEALGKISRKEQTKEVTEESETTIESGFTKDKELDTVQVKTEKMTVDTRPDDEAEEEESDNSSDKSNSDDMEIDENKDNETVESDNSSMNVVENVQEKSVQEMPEPSREDVQEQEEDVQESDKILDESDISIKEEVLSINDYGGKESSPTFGEKLNEALSGSEQDVSISDNQNDNEQTGGDASTNTPGSVTDMGPTEPVSDNNIQEKKESPILNGTPGQTPKKKSRTREISYKSKKAAIDISDPAFLKPFDFGWKRELVYRSTNDTQNRRQSDVYYYTPKGKKVRSFREVLEHLVGQDLTIDNFTFFKEALGVEDTEKEIIRDAKLKIKDTSFGSPSPILKKTLMPKTPKTPKTTPISSQETLVVTPSSTTTSGPPNIPKSLTPRVVFRGGKSKLGNYSSTPKFTATQSKNSIPGLAQKIIISKVGKRSRKKSEEELEMGMLPPMWQPVDKVSKTRDKESSVAKKSASASSRGGKPMEVCNIRCPLAMGLIPTLQCHICLCLYHPECVGLEEAINRTIHSYKCKNCQLAPPKPAPAPKTPVTMNSVGGILTPPPLTPISTLNSINSSHSQFGHLSLNNPPPKLTRLTDGKIVSVPRTISKPPVTKAQSIVGGVTTWLPPSSTIQLSPSTPKLSPSFKNSSPAPTSTVDSSTNLPAQTLITMNGKRFVVVPKHNVLSVSPAVTAPSVSIADPSCPQITPSEISPSLTALATQAYGPGGPILPKPTPTSGATFLVSSPATPTTTFQNPPGVLLVPYLAPQSSQHQVKDGVQQPPQPQYVIVNGPSGLQAGNFIFGNLPQQQLKLPAIPTSQAAEPPAESAGTKRLADNLDKSPPTKKLKFDAEYRSNCMQNFVQNMGIGYKALLQAFQYLTVQELLRAGRVCHMWRDIAMHKSLWETVRMKNSRVRDWEGVSQTLRRVGTRHLDLRKIIIPDKSDSLRSMWSDFIKSIAKVNTLVKLDLCRCSSQLIEQVATACPQLENLNALSIRSNELNLTAVGGCKNMTELRLKSVAGIGVSNIIALKALTKLKHLSLTSIKNVTSDFVEILNKMVVLETLELGECTMLPEKLITESLPGLTRLRRLRLEKGQGTDCPTILLLETISRCSSLTQLELINFDVKPGFDNALALCSNIKSLLIIPTYVTQSATTNHVVMEGVSKLSKTLTYFVWGLTLELLRVTDLFIDQWEGQKNANKQGTTPHKKSTNDCIPILKPEKDSSLKSKGGSAPLQVDVLQLAKLHKVLMTLLPTTQIKILKVPFSATWRQTIPGSSQ